MSTSKSLSNRLEEVLLNGKWIANTNIQEQLGKTNFVQANFKIGDHNSIAELTYHINYYVGGILDVFKGGDLVIRDQYSFDMEKIESESDWQKLLESFRANSLALVGAVTDFPENRWKEVFTKAIYGTYERNIEGLIEHSYYHFGQISLLLKLINDPSTKGSR